MDYFEHNIVLCEYTIGCKNRMKDGNWEYSNDHKHPKYNKKCFICEDCENEFKKKVNEANEDLEKELEQSKKKIKI
jgi:hypothetical protein